MSPGRKGLCPSETAEPLQPLASEWAASLLCLTNTGAEWGVSVRGQARFQPLLACARGHSWGPFQEGSPCSSSTEEDFAQLQNRLSVGARRGLRGTKCRGEEGSVAGGTGCPAAPQPQQHPHPARPLCGWQRGPGAAAAPQPYLTLRHRPCVPEGFRAAISSLVPAGLERSPSSSSELFTSQSQRSLSAALHQHRAFVSDPAGQPRANPVHQGAKKAACCTAPTNSRYPLHWGCPVSASLPLFI